MILNLDKWKFPISYFNISNREKLYKLLLCKLYGVPLTGWESDWHGNIKLMGKFNKTSHETDCYTQE